MVSAGWKTLTQTDIVYKNTFKILEIEKVPIFSLEMEGWPGAVIDGELWATSWGHD